MIKAQELFRKLDGSLVERQEIKHELGFFFALVQDPIPEDIQRERQRKKQTVAVIEIEPINM